MPFIILQQDITALNVDAIVNAANTDLRQGGGVCGAIFRAAGAEDMRAACEPLAPIRTGDAVLTPGFRLPATFVIHTAGPVYRDGNSGEAELLRRSYANSLNLAAEHGCESLAFPLISAGIYGYPKDEALRIACETVTDFLSAYEGDMKVLLTLFDKSLLALAETVLSEIRTAVETHIDSDREEPSFTE